MAQELKGTSYLFSPYGGIRNARLRTQVQLFAPSTLILKGLNFRMESSTYNINDSERIGLEMKVKTLRPAVLTLPVASVCARPRLKLGEERSDRVNVSKHMKIKR